MSDIRKSILAQEDLIASKSRFGLFSQPAPLAVCDDGPYSRRPIEKGEDGKPKTQPRNLLAGANRTGALLKSYLHVPSSIYSNDPYVDTFKIAQQYEVKMKTKVIHEANFRSSHSLKTLAKSSYPYVASRPSSVKRVQREADGRVKTKPRNILSNPCSKVERDELKPYPFISDPFDRKDKIAAQQRLLSNKKMPETLFRSMSYGDNLFSKHKLTYGIDEQAAQVIQSRKSPFLSRKSKSMTHEDSFRPAIRGHGDPLGKYPEFIMPEEKSIGKERKGKQAKEAWRPHGSTNLSRPTPSISLMNLRR